MKNKIGRPSNTKGSHWKENISLFSGLPLTWEQHRKEKTLLGKLKRLNLLQYMKIYCIKKPGYEEMSEIKGIASLKCISPKELVDSIIRDYIRSSKKKLE